LLPKILTLYKKYPFLIAATAIVIAYIPLLSGIMSVKNDTIVLSYPIFHYFSTHIQEGILPLWHYNMHLGFAMYADPGTPFINPFFILFALAGKSVFIYTAYLLFHIYLGTYGMYLLGKQLQFKPILAAILAVAYTAGGYFVSHLQHSNHIVECTYLPFVINYLYAIFNKPSLKKCLLLALAFYLFTVGGYPGFYIALPYYIVILAFGYVLAARKKGNFAFTNYKKPLMLIAGSGVIAFILCSPYLYGLFSNFSNFQRGNSFTGNEYLEKGGIRFLSMLSFLWPLTNAVKETPFHASDICWNNMFIGIVPFVFIVTALRKLKSYNLTLILPHLIAAIFFTVISFEGNLKIIFTKLPLLNFLRYNGGLRVYAVLSLLVIAGYLINQYLSDENPKAKLYVSAVKPMLIVVIFICIATLLWKLLLPNNTVSTANSLVKQILNIPFTHALVLQSFYVILILFLVSKLYYKKKWLLALTLIDVIICFFINLPFTGLSIKSTPRIVTDIATAVKMVNKPTQQLITLKNQQAALNHVMVAPILYCNRVGLIKAHDYPSGKKSYFHFLESIDSNYFNNKPVCFLASDTTKALNYSINAQKINIECYNTSKDTLYIYQNYDIHWQANSNSTNLNIQPWQGTFIQIPLSEKTNNIILQYKDPLFINLFIISFSSLTTIVITLLLLYYKKRKN
jgi:hypothetical protein